MNVVEKLEECKQRGMNEEEAWNACLLEIYRASMAHCLLIILTNFVQVVEKNKEPSSVHKILKALCDLFSLHQMEEVPLPF